MEAAKHNGLEIGSEAREPGLKSKLQQMRPVCDFKQVIKNLFVFIYASENGHMISAELTEG